MATKKSTVQFSAEEFVDNLLKNGATVACDETVESFNQNHLPPFYDETTFRRGQKFFHKNIFALFFGKLLGLLTVLAIPSIYKILIFTNMSNSPMTSYKRYLSTIFHMFVWYDSDFYPGSKLWNSIRIVRNLHNSTSKRCCNIGMHRINQKDMALTQFGFMGYALARNDMIGAFTENDEDWYAFTHIWRVVGYIMGIEDRFNICRDSIDETRKICKVLIQKVFKPSIERDDPNFITMSSNLIRGMWAMNPTLQVNVFITYLNQILQNGNSNNNNNNDNNCSLNKKYNQLTTFEKFHYWVIVFAIYGLKFKICRLYHNSVMYISLWLMKVFPFLAYYRYGYANSHVHIYIDEINNIHSVHND